MLLHDFTPPARTFAVTFLFSGWRGGTCRAMCLCRIDRPPPHTTALPPASDSKITPKSALVKKIVSFKIERLEGSGLPALRLAKHHFRKNPPPQQGWQWLLPRARRLNLDRLEKL
jgi:hypothetical protein